MYLRTFIQLLVITLITAQDKNYTDVVAEPRIYGGTATTQEELGGYAVQIIRQIILFVCTGCLLSERHVVTAAHCFDNANYRDYYVVAGETDLFYPLDGNYVVQAMIHPDYYSYDFSADIAVLRVASPIRGRNIGYLPLCSMALNEGNMVTVSGWGRTDAEPSNVLRSMEVPVVSNSECSQKIRRPIPENVVCASGYNGKTVCLGDSGGPLVYNGELCGITVITYGCGENIKPDIFMSVYYYRNFIENAMKTLGD